MKRSLFVLALLGMMAGAVDADVLRTGLQMDNTQLVDTVFFWNSATSRFPAKTVFIYLDENASGPVIIQRGMRNGSISIITFIDDPFTLYPGKPFISQDDGITCFRFTKTSATDPIWSSASQGSETITFGPIASPLAAVTDKVLLANSFVIPASGKMTFSKPLVPVGDHKSVTFTIKCIGTPPDTLYYQIVGAQTSMDTLSVVNLGTIAAPLLTGYLAYPLDNSPFHSTGIEMPVQVNLYNLSNSKFIGIRLHPDDSRAATVYVVCNLK